MLPVGYTWLNEDQIRKASQRTLYFDTYILKKNREKGMRRRRWILHEHLQKFKDGEIRIAILDSQLPHVKP
jgi:hypothetical protein